MSCFLGEQFQLKRRKACWWERFCVLSLYIFHTNVLWAHAGMFGGGGGFGAAPQIGGGMRPFAPSAGGFAQAANQPPMGFANAAMGGFAQAANQPQIGFAQAANQPQMGFANAATGGFAQVSLCAELCELRRTFAHMCLAQGGAEWVCPGRRWWPGFTSLFAPAAGN
jgi:hypothetical protein